MVLVLSNTGQFRVSSAACVMAIGVFTCAQAAGLMRPTGSGTLVFSVGERNADDRPLLGLTGLAVATDQCPPIEAKHGHHDLTT